ncbi:MAG TPA: carboxypeptidase M32 [Candidatus Methylomirabilis sp.]|nr:carboxypeptidase M32 [Candidatus Methylomirabilis sp.]
MARAPEEAYAELIQRAKAVALLESCASLLHWDQQTYMPPKGSAHRAEQLALLAGMIHQQATAPEVGGLLATVEGSQVVREPDAPAAVNVRELRRTYDRATKLPRSLVEELARTCALAHEVWVEAREHSNFDLFRPWLEKVVALKRQEAEAVGYSEVPYDALLDDYEPGETTARLREMFAELRDELVELVGCIAASGRHPDLSILHREYPIERQEAFGRAAAAAIGFDFTAGRLDVTAHPFCSGIGPGDTRLTTRYNPRDFGDAFFSVMHEAGHGLYDQGLDPSGYGTPMGCAVSLGIHESQSRLWENFVGRSRAFWEHFFPRARQAFPGGLEDASLDVFHFAINDVRPSFIRVDADEATYNLHILLRFELEQALVAGDLKAADVPGAWNERFRRYLDLTPPDDARGCLQDIHWSGGGIGYFPTYTLGNLYAAQFFAQAQADLGDLSEQFRRGEFAPLREWLNIKIHRHGQRHRAADLVRAVTGRPLGPRPLLDHLRSKYAPLYGI